MDPVQEDVRGYQAAGYSFLGYSYLPRALSVINNLPWLSIPNRVSEVVFGRSLSGRDFGRYLTTGERVTTAAFVVLDIFFLASLYKKPLLTAGQRLLGLIEREAVARNLTNVRLLEEAAELLTNMLARGTTGCFAAGTPVMTPDGSKAIESLQVGDTIYSRDQHDPAAPLDVQHVEQVFRKIAPLWTASIGGQPIRMTSEHPLYVQDVGWVPLREIRVGSEVLGMNGEWVTIDAVTPSDVAVEVYNIQVANHHTFFIGDTLWGFSVWVHNEQICQLLARVQSTVGNAAEHQAAREALATRLLNRTPVDVAELGNANLVAKLKSEGFSLAGIASEATYVFKSPAARHRLDKVRQSTLTKNLNTVSEPGLNVAADVAAINSGLAQRVGDRFIVNGRTYGHHDGILYPISGPGLHQLDRGGFRALGILNVFGDTPRAAEIMQMRKLTAEAIEAGRTAWRAGQR